MYCEPNFPYIGSIPTFYIFINLYFNTAYSMQDTMFIALFKFLCRIHTLALYILDIIPGMMLYKSIRTKYIINLGLISTVKLYVEFGQKHITII